MRGGTDDFRPKLVNSAALAPGAKQRSYLPMSMLPGAVDQFGRRPRRVAVVANFLDTDQLELRWLVDARLPARDGFGCELQRVAAAALPSTYSRCSLLSKASIATRSPPRHAPPIRRYATPGIALGQCAMANRVERT